MGHHTQMQQLCSQPVPQPVPGMHYSVTLPLTPNQLNLPLFESTSIAMVEELFQEKQMDVSKVQLDQAQQRMKSHDYRKGTWWTFELENLVYLKLHSYNKDLLPKEECQAFSQGLWTLQGDRRCRTRWKEGKGVLILTENR